MDRDATKLSGGQLPAPAAGARADQRPRDPLPRRADHRPRPAGAPQLLGPGAHDPGARQDRRAHHALHGRGRTCSATRSRSWTTARSSRAVSRSGSCASTSRTRSSSFRARTSGRGDGRSLALVRVERIDRDPDRRRQRDARAAAARRRRAPASAGASRGRSKTSSSSSPAGSSAADALETLPRRPRRAQQGVPARPRDAGLGPRVPDVHAARHGVHLQRQERAHSSSVAVLGAPAPDDAFFAGESVQLVPVDDLDEALAALERHGYDLVVDPAPPRRYWINASSSEGLGARDAPAQPSAVEATPAAG